MPRLLNKINDPASDTRKFNENFDRISLDIADRSGVFSSVASVPSGILISAGATAALEVSIIDTRTLTEQGKLPIIPRMDIFIDDDSTFQNSYPLGGNLTAAEVHGIRITHYQSKTTLNAQTNEKATYVIAFHNDDVDAHTIYVNFQGFYVPPPDIGIALRAVS